MADNTLHYGLPYPEGRDGVVVHTDIERLAKQADTRIKADVETTAAQKASEAVGDLHPRMNQSERTLGPVLRGANHVYEIKDLSGATAFAVDEYGRTHIYDLATNTTGAPSTLHVFIAAGQSNMSGRGLPIEGPQSPRIMQYGANSRVIEHAPLQLDMVDSPAGTSPALFFAHNYLATQPSDVGVLLIPAARGATTFNGSPSNPADTWTWVKDAAINPEHALYNRSVEQAREAIAAAKAAGYHVILKGVLWHQGEGNSSTAPEVYAGWLDDLIRNYRDDLEAPDLPVLVGQMAPEGIDLSPNRQQIDRVHRETPQRVPYTGFAPATYGGHNPGDTTHFSTFGTSHLGNTFATAYLQAVGNHRPGPQIALDASVGTRVYVGDTMIHGDTGVRDVSSYLNADDVVDGLATIQRENSTVFLSFYNMLFRPGTGFRDIMTLGGDFRGMRSVDHSYDTAGRLFVQNNAINEYGISKYATSIFFTKTITRNSVTQEVPDVGLSGMLIFQTTESWPTTLPGTPA